MKKEGLMRHREGKSKGARNQTKTGTQTKVNDKEIYFQTKHQIRNLKTETNTSSDGGH